jgi:hypothetical protein
MCPRLTLARKRMWRIGIDTRDNECTFTNRSLNIAHDESILVIQELDTHLSHLSPWPCATNHLHDNCQLHSCILKFKQPCQQSYLVNRRKDSPIKSKQLEKLTWQCTISMATSSRCYYCMGWSSLAKLSATIPQSISWCLMFLISPYPSLREDGDPAS